MMTRAAIVGAARAWLGTPYHHQASRKGAGCDCLGLIRGVWRELYGPEPEALPPYTRDWGSATGSETLLKAARRHLVRLDEVSEAGPGDVLVFRMRDRGVAKHAGILVSRLPKDPHPEEPPKAASRRVRPMLRDAPLHGAPQHEDFMHLIHAQEGLGVVEIELGLWWRRRAAAAFRFPGVS